MHVILMGPQGSGKGTQAETVAPLVGLVKVSTGELFRAAIAAGSELGREVKALLDAGELVSDPMTVAVVEVRLDEIAAAAAGGAPVRGAIFDGFPRTRGQAEALDAALVRRQDAVVAVVLIDVPLATLIARLAGRRVCRFCGAAYHLEFNPPAVAGICDRCGHELVQREDDKPEAIQRRLALYREQTEPLLAYYREQGLVSTINGDQVIEAVTHDLLQVLAERGVDAIDGASAGA